MSERWQVTSFQESDAFSECLVGKKEFVIEEDDPTDETGKYLCRLFENPKTHKVELTRLPEED